MKPELFYEKFRCKSLEQLSLVPRIRESLGDGVLKQNILLYSATPGTSKTTTARILAKNTSQTILEINASRESSVEIIRTKIEDFCSTMSVLDGQESFKVVILDEVDGFSDQAFKALRGTIEDVRFQDNVRFILTCNYLNKIPEPVQSRFLCINYDPISNEEETWLKGEYAKRFGMLFGALKIQITPEALSEFVDKNFPDMRTMYNKVQSFRDRKVESITIDVIRQSSYSFQELYDMLFGEIKPVQMYQFVVSNYSGQTEDVLYAIGGDLIQYIREKQPKHMDKIPNIIITAADYQAKRLQVIDPVVNCLAAIFTVQKIINSGK